jgi:phosphoglycolate phosphatase
MADINLSRKQHVIWDWNGTLLDDLDLCLRIINNLLRERGLNSITKDRYLEVFGFPVRDYYLKLGFNFDQEPFEVVSTEFITAYEKGRPDCQLFPGCSEVLSAFQKQGLSQSILSASKRTYLERAVLEYDIEGYFNSVLGLEDHHAAGKLTLAKTYMKDNHPDPNSVILIGDTIHDAEIADQLGIQCILLPSGHQSRSRLVQTNGFLLDNIIDLKEYLNS